MDMKMSLKMPKLSFRTIISAIFILIVAAELLFTSNYLYKNLKPEPAVQSTQGIIRADLSGYSQVYNDITSRGVYVPNPYDFQNPNPFQFGP